MSKKEIALCAVSVLFAVMLLEVGTRLLMPKKQPAIPREVGRFDAQLGWALRPLSHATSTRTGYEINYKINSKGLRDDEADYNKPQSLYRIVLVGDSRTFGLGVPIEKHFSTLLEGYFQNVEVINMGVGGFGVDQELLYLRSEGFRYEPDLVMAYVAHYADHRHMHSERFGKSKPYFQLVDGNLVLNSSTVKEKTTNRWSDSSRVYEILLAAVDRFQKSRSPSAARKRTDKRNSRNPQFEDEVNRLGEAIVFQMKAEALKHGAEFVLVTNIHRLHAAAVEKGVLSINVAEALDNTLFDLPDKLKHINESGNGVLAWEIARFLRENRIIPVDHQFSATRAAD